MGLLAGWQHYIDLTVPAAKVTDDLAHFPVCIQIRDGAGINSADLTPIFDEVGANYKKIAVTAEDGVTQLYCEVVSWSSGDEYAELWVSKSGWTLNGGVENKVRIYFDNDHADNDSYVGLTGSTPAENVWDSNFKLVCHMEDNPDTGHVMDSTSNDNDGTKKAANEPIEATGKIGKGQNCDGVDDYIALSPTFLDGLASVTFSCWIKPSTYLSGIWGSWAIRAKSAADLNIAEVCVRQDDDVSVSVSAGTDHNKAATWAGWTEDTDSHITGVYDGSHISLFLNGEYKTQTACTGNILTPNSLTIGGYNIAQFFYHGIIDELHFSNVARSVAWVGASYETQRDQFYNCGGFVTLNPIALFCA